MANLSETVATNLQLAAAEKVMRTCLTKKDLSLSAAAEKSCCSKRFYLVRLPIRKLPLFEVEASNNGSSMIIVDVNEKRKRITASGFKPKVILLKGLRTLQAEKGSDKLFCNAWVGDKALKKLRISAEDAIGANELQTKLQRLIAAKYKNRNSSKASDSLSYSPSPWINEVYPFDSYFIFNYDGDTYKQTYSLNDKTREPSLTGEPVEVFVKYVPEAVSASSLSDMLYGETYIDRTMSQEMTFDQANYSGPTLGRVGYAPPIVPDGTYYPAGSELARPELRTMLNVKEALTIFLTLLKGGMTGPMRHSFSPVAISTDRFLMNACAEAEIAAKEARKKIDTLAFVSWQHTTLTQRGTPKKYDLASSAYAYVGDPKDISTWHLQADDKDTIKSALRHVMHCDGIPDKKKETVKMKLKAMLRNVTGKAMAI